MTPEQTTFINHFHNQELTVAEISDSKLDDKLRGFLSAAPFMGDERLFSLGVLREYGRERLEASLERVKGA